MVLPFALTLLTASAVQQAPLSSPPKPEVDLPSDFAVARSLESPMFQRAADGSVWARGKNYRASFEPGQFSFYPVFGKQSPQEYPVEYRLDGVTVGGQQLELHAGDVARDGTSVSLDHGSLREVYHLDVNQVEQTFVFDNVEGAGDLVVRMDVTTELVPRVDDDGLHFEHSEFGKVTYGDAFVLDAEGARLPIERNWDGKQISLTVPASFLADAVFPVTIDPPNTVNLSNSFGNADDTLPDMIWGGANDRLWVVWEEFTSAANADVFITSFNGVGNQGSTGMIDATTSESWRRPKIAYDYSTGRVMVIAEVTEAGFPRSVRAQVRDVSNPNSQTVVAPNFFVSNPAFVSGEGDVGGNKDATTGATSFCVVYESDLAAPGQSQSFFTAFDSDGVPVAGTAVGLPVTGDLLGHAVSDSTGTSGLPDQGWMVASIFDDNGDGRGQLRCARISAAGVVVRTITADSNNSCASPSITSLLDQTIEGTTDARGAVVAYDRDQDGDLSGPRSVFAGVVAIDSLGAVFSTSNVSGTMSDIDGDVDQFDPSVCATRKMFFISYSEEYFAAPGSGDFDIYMASGSPSFTTSGLGIALSERHQILDFSSAPSVNSVCCSYFDGETNPSAIGNNVDNAFALWQRGVGASGGALLGGGLEGPTDGFLEPRPVGRQYCDARANSRSSSFSSEVSTWMWIEGTAKVDEDLTIRCVDVPPNQFGLLLASRSAGNSPLNAGQLCLSGGIGRYNAQIQSSGASGTFTATVDPTAILQPSTLDAAVPGETWHFQFWHRDVQGGGPVANLSNGCRVTFLP